MRTGTRTADQLIREENEDVEVDVDVDVSRGPHSLGHSHKVDGVAVHERLVVSIPFW